MPLRAASPSSSRRSSHVYCLLCDYDITGATIAGNCPECGEPIMRSFEWPHDDGIPHPVPCARCGHALEREPIDSGCAECGYAVLKTLRGPRSCDPTNPTYAPFTLMTGLITIPLFVFFGFGVLILAAIALALFIPAYWEFRQGAASQGAFIAACVGAVVSVVWFLAAAIVLLSDIRHA